jgi:hypothetical protein
MQSGPDRTYIYPDESVPPVGSRRRRHEVRRLVRFHPSNNTAWAFVVGLAAALAATDHALAQEPMVPPPVPITYPVPSRPHHWCDFFLPNDGIPRTYSYYYSPWLNQPRHFRVVRPDGKTYWTSTVRGLPMGYQWLAQ